MRDILLHRLFLGFWLALSVLPTPGSAQNTSLEALLERQLSGDGRVVEIDGFTGALSSQARMAALRVADGDGIWLEMTDLSLDWNRAALLTGRLEVAELRAGRIAVLRATVSEETVDIPNAEATALTIPTVPDIPVAILIDRVAAEEIFLDASLLGEAVTATADLSARLEDGALDLTLRAARVDSQPGEARLAMTYRPVEDVPSDDARGQANPGDPASPVLSLDLNVSEPPGGVIARALALTGLPSVDLTLTGQGPLNDFSADLALATAGVERFGGTVTLSGASSGAAFAADLAGDLRPLLDAETAAFFGPETRLRASGVRETDGRIELSDFTAETQALALNGTATLGPSGAPERFALNGSLRGPVALPGGGISIGDARLRAAFDAEISEAWTVSGQVSDIDAGDAKVATLDLQATGLISPDAAVPFTGRVDATASGVALASQPGLAAALGGPDTPISVGFDVAASAQGATLRDLAITTANAAVTGAGNLTLAEGGGQIASDLRLTAPDLRPFAALAGRPTAGRVEANVSATLAFPSLAATVELDARTQALALGVPALAPLLTPQSALRTALIRDAAGTRIDAFLFDNPELSVALTGALTGEGGDVALTARLREAALFTDAISGPVTLSAQITDPQTTQGIAAEFRARGLSATLDGALAEGRDALSIEASLASLAQFMPGLRGGASLTADVTDLRGIPDISARFVTDNGARARVSGTVDPADATVNLASDGRLPLALAQAVIGDRSLTGDVTFDLAVVGPPALSALSGRVDVVDGRFFDAGLGITLSPIALSTTLGAGQATFAGEAVLDNVPIRVSGEAGLVSPFPLEASLRTRRLPVRYADILSNETSLDITLAGAAAERLVVSGEVRIEDTEIRIPDTGLGGAPTIPPIRHENAPDAVRQTLARAGLPLDALAVTAATDGGLAIPLDIGVSVLTPVFVRGRGVDAGFEGSLRIQGTASSPQAVGELALTRGRLDFLGRRLDLTEGRITLAGALLPRMDIFAQTEVDDITAEIGLSGPVDAPDLTLSSTPELPEDEVLARILFGRGIETLSAFQVARLVLSIRTLSGSGGDGILENTRQSLGVDDLDLRTDAQTGETALAIGQTIDEGVYSEVEVNSAGSTTLSLNFDVTDSTTLRGSANTEGETGLGIFWQRDY